MEMIRVLVAAAFNNVEPSTKVTGDYRVVRDPDQIASQFPHQDWLRVAVLRCLHDEAHTKQVERLWVDIGTETKPTFVRTGDIVLRHRNTILQQLNELHIKTEQRVQAESEAKDAQETDAEDLQILACIQEEARPFFEIRESTGIGQASLNAKLRELQRKGMVVVQKKDYPLYEATPLGAALLPKTTTPVVASAVVAPPRRTPAVATRTPEADQNDPLVHTLNGRSLSMQEIEAAIGMERSVFLKRLRRLVENGHITQTGTKRWARYSVGTVSDATPAIPRQQTEKESRKSPSPQTATEGRVQNDRQLQSLLVFLQEPRICFEIASHLGVKQSQALGILHHYSDCGFIEPSAADVTPRRYRVTTIGKQHLAKMPAVSQPKPAAEAVSAVPEETAEMLTHISAETYVRLRKAIELTTEPRRTKNYRNALALSENRAQHLLQIAVRSNLLSIRGRGPGTQYVRTALANVWLEHGEASGGNPALKNQARIPEANDTKELPSNNDAEPWVHPSAYRSFNTSAFAPSDNFQPEEPEKIRPPIRVQQPVETDEHRVLREAAELLEFLESPRSPEDISKKIGQGAGEERSMELFVVRGWVELGTNGYVRTERGKDTIPQLRALLKGKTPPPPPPPKSKGAHRSREAVQQEIDEQKAAEAEAQLATRGRKLKPDEQKVLDLCSGELQSLQMLMTKARLTEEAILPILRELVFLQRVVRNNRSYRLNDQVAVAEPETPKETTPAAAQQEMTPQTEAPVATKISGQALRRARECLTKHANAIRSQKLTEEQAEDALTAIATLTSGGTIQLIETLRQFGLQRSHYEWLAQEERSKNVIKKTKESREKTPVMGTGNYEKSEISDASVLDYCRGQTRSMRQIMKRFAITSYNDAIMLMDRLEAAGLVMRGGKKSKPGKGAKRKNFTYLSVYQEPKQQRSEIHEGSLFKGAISSERRNTRDYTAATLRAEGVPSYMHNVWNNTAEALPLDPQFVPSTLSDEQADLRFPASYDGSVQIGDFTLGQMRGIYSVIAEDLRKLGDRHGTNLTVGHVAALLKRPRYKDSILLSGISPEELLHWHADFSLEAPPLTWPPVRTAEEARVPGCMSPHIEKWTPPAKAAAAAQKKKASELSEASEAESGDNDDIADADLDEENEPQEVL